MVASDENSGFPTVRNATVPSCFRRALFVNVAAAAADLTQSRNQAPGLPGRGPAGTARSPGDPGHESAVMVGLSFRWPWLTVTRSHAGVTRPGGLQGRPGNRTTALAAGPLTRSQRQESGCPGAGYHDHDGHVSHGHLEPWYPMIS
jgi:hypothetical protein